MLQAVELHLRFCLLLVRVHVRTYLRRSPLAILNPTLGVFAAIAILGAFFGAILKREVGDFASYVPFLGAGIIVWVFIASGIHRSSYLFAHQEQALYWERRPFVAYPMAVVLQAALVLVLNIVVGIVVHALWLDPPTIHFLPLLGGVLLLMGNGLWMAVLAAIICVRFRDLPQTISWLLHLVFLLTPILWQEHFLGSYQYLLLFNPFYHLLEIVRAPLLGHEVAALAWLVSSASLAVGTTAMIVVSRVSRDRMPYWS